MKAAYADPPYLGQARRHYSDDPQCAEVDHVQLIKSLCAEYDCWAMSTHTPGLKIILPLCPDSVRVLAWVKPFCSFKPGVGVAYAWEPIIIWQPRPRTRVQPTVRDWIAENIMLRRGCAGAKPIAFCFWLFEVLNLNPELDTFYDLFPGSGAVTKAWDAWKKIKLNKQESLTLNQPRW